MTNAKIGQITADTLVPISVLAVLAGGMIFLTTIYNQGVANANAILELKAAQNSYVETVQRIDKRLTRIETKLGVNE